MGNVRIKLTFPEQLIKQPPWAASTASSTSGPTSAGPTLRTRVGWIVCELAGEAHAVEEAVAWLEAKGVQVDRLGDVVES